MREREIVTHTERERKIDKESVCERERYIREKE